MNKILFIIFLSFLFTQATCAEEAIIFSRLTDGYWQVWAMKPDGSNQKQITDSKNDKRDPVCMDQGKRILFRTSNGQLMSKNLTTGEEQEQLSQYKSINNPAYCDATAKVLFVRYDPREVDISDLWVSDLNGKDPVILTKDKRLKYQPVFDQSCEHVAFVKADDSGQSHHLWVMASDGTEARQVTEGQGFDTQPDFLPGSAGLVFSSNRNGHDYELYKISFPDHVLTHLTDNDVLDKSPAVSTDGQRVLYVSTQSGSQQVWIMNVDGKGTLQLTNAAEESLDPQWCPVEEKN